MPLTPTDDPLATCTLSEPLRAVWPDQLLRWRVEFAAPVDLDRAALVDADGKRLAFQTADVVPARGGRVRAATLWFWRDVSAGETLELRLVLAKRRRKPKPTLRCTRTRKAVTLANEQIRIKLPASQRFGKPRPAMEVPGPILGFGRPGQPWIGGSRWEAALACRRIETQIRAHGPLWSEAEVRFCFEHGAAYAVRLCLYAGHDFVVLDERPGLRVDARLLLSLYKGLAPDRFYTHGPGPNLDKEGHSKVAPIDYGCAERVREVQMPAIGAYYVPHLVGHIGVFNARARRKGLVGIVGLDGEVWESAIHNRMRLATRTDPDLVLELPAKAGRRRWMLTVTDVAPAVTTGAGEQSALLARKIHHGETRLRDVLAMDLDPAGRAGAEPIFFTDKRVAHARKRLTRVPAFRERLRANDKGELTDPAFAYLLTGKRAFAEQTRDRMRQGMRMVLDWILHGGGVAETGCLRLARPTRGWTAMLDLIRREPGILDNDTGVEIGRLLLFFAQKMAAGGMWPQDRVALHYDHPESQKPLYSYPGDRLPDRLYWSNCLPNFQSDWLIALASIGLCFPGHPDARAWVDRCVEDLDAQLDNFVFETGAWIESQVYALATLSYFLPFFIMLKRQGIRDYWADERVLRWLAWHTRMLTPPDPRIGGRRTQAPIGNAILPDGQSAVFNWAAQFVPDRTLANDLATIWHLAGEPVSAGNMGWGGGHTRVHDALFDPDLKSKRLPARHSRIEPGFGAVLRHDEGRDEETFLTFKNGLVFSHYEGDELSFHWHARGVPLCSDYGVYQAPSAQWNAHNVVEVPRSDHITRGFLSDHELDGSADYLVGDHPKLIRFMEDHPEGLQPIPSDPKAPRFRNKYNYLDHEAPLGPKIWSRRTLLFVKPHYLVLLDDVDGETPTRFNLHCVADRVRVAGRRIDFSGRFGVNLSAFVIAPDAFSTETGRHAPERGDVDHSQRFVRILSQSANHYHTVLYPWREGETVSCEPLADRIGVAVTSPSGRDRVWLARTPETCEGPDYAFVGRAGFVRETGTRIALHLLRGRHLAAAGLTIEGSGPVHVEPKSRNRLLVRTNGPARRVRIADDTTDRKVADRSDGVRIRQQGAAVVLDVAPGAQSAMLERKRA